MTVHDLAALRGSIAWEVLDAFTSRLSRIYTDGGSPVGVRYLDGRLQRGGEPRDQGDGESVGPRGRRGRVALR